MDFKEKATQVLERQGIRSIAQRMAMARGLTGEAAAQFERELVGECVDGLATDLQAEAEGEANAITRRIMEA